MLLGVDTGGTFTDFVVVIDGQVRIHKVLSTPKAPEQAILQGIKELGVGSDALLIVHGSTVATNAVLEKKGVRCCFITNTGLADLLTIGRQARKELYNLNPKPVPPPVPAGDCLEVPSRVSAQAEKIESMSEEALQKLIQQVEDLAPEAVAINLLFSFLNDDDERRIEQAMPSDIFVSRSSRVLPEYKEYERGMATWLNAYVGPLVTGYLERLVAAVSAKSVSVMQSSGGTIAANLAGEQAVRMLLSGPAGGLMAALQMGKQAGFERLLTLDMGGTSTDVSLLDGGIGLTNEGKIADYPVAVPMVDIHTIGAGGGSLASIDSGGMLCVGPESAGAMPGPVCYGKGGEQVTVTDANLFLGRISEDHFLGGKMKINVASSNKAVEDLAVELGCSARGAAEGVINLTNEHMASALRVISVQRGIDPRPYALMTFGGAGGLHVCALAEALEIKTAVVPVCSGVLSAFGMLVAPRSRMLSQSLVGVLNEMSISDIEVEFKKLVNQGTEELLAEGVPKEKINKEYQLDLRYLGQSYTLSIAWKNKQSAIDAFHKTHEARYEHSLDLPVELVNLRVALSGELPQPNLKKLPSGTNKAALDKVGDQKSGMIKRVQREQLSPNDCFEGEALIVETVATTYLAPGWRCKVDDYGNLILTKNENN
ncbi:MAG: hydantoinase [Cycloclasticus sp. symbiont of Poecilosclerida sp. M]|nr:MAG: hydantoinase [Cycloclasticus sp. symbiont of Poecilosclerida sp. M]